MVSELSGMARLPHALVILLAALMMCGCAPKVDKSNVVLWTAFEGGELETLRARVSDFEKESGKRVTLLKVPFGSLQSKMLVAGPALQGPDVLIGPQDWIGILQTADLLAPIPGDVVGGESDDYYPVALSAVSYDDAIYSVPMMMDCVVLARNTQLISEKPENLEQLVDIAKKCQQENPGVLGFAYRLDNLYFTWPFLAGHGAKFFDPFRAKQLSIDSINFDTPETVAGCQWVADLQVKESLVPSGLENETAVDYFLNNKLGMMLCGPWNLSAMRSKKVPYVLEPLPAGPAGECSPFLGVTGAMLSRYSVDKPGVKELLAFLGSAETGAQLCQASGRAPARKDSAQLLQGLVSDPVVARDLALFAEATQTATALPNHPAVSTVWPSMKTSLELITTGQIEPSKELQSTTERVRTKIRFMTE